MWCKETDAGIVIRGAKYETASGYADQGFLKPTVGAWTNEKLSDYAVGCIVRMGAPGVKHIARSGFAGRASAADYPLANKFDEVDFLMVLDDVLIPWEDVFFYRHTARRPVYPRHAASLFGLSLHAARPLRRRHDDRRGAVERQADRPRQAAGGAREARRSGLLSRGHQRASDGLDRARRSAARAAS